MAFRILICYSKQGREAVKPSHTPHPPSPSASGPIRAWRWIRKAHPNGII